MNGYPTYPSSRGAFAQQQGNADSIMDLTGGDMDAAFAMGHGQSLDDIVSSNDKADRRRSMPVYAGNQMHLDGPDARRFSSMNFGGPGTPCCPRPPSRAPPPSCRTTAPPPPTSP
jgi:hypothetical protein